MLATITKVIMLNIEKHLKTVAQEAFCLVCKSTIKRCKKSVHTQCEKHQANLIVDGYDSDFDDVFVDL